MRRAGHRRANASARDALVAWLALALVCLHPAPATAQRIENSVAIFAALDKVTAKISRLEVPLGQIGQFRRAQSHPARVLHARADRAAQDHHLRRGRREDARRQGEAHLLGLDVRRCPGLNAVEHPVFDVWLTDCSHPRASAQRPPQATRARRPHRRRRRSRSVGAAAPPPRPALIPVSAQHAVDDGEHLVRSGVFRQGQEIGLRGPGPSPAAHGTRCGRSRPRRTASGAR